MTLKGWKSVPSLTRGGRNGVQSRAVTSMCPCLCACCCTKHWCTRSKARGLPGFFVCQQM